MQAFNIYTSRGDGTEPAYRPNDAAGFTLADLNVDANRYYVQLIPPGQIRKQIKSGCMLLGNDEDRNFLPGNIQVDFDVSASTNYNLMQDLANNGFIDEAVPYIANRLDRMVAVTNPKKIGTDSYTGNADFDKQFDIAMDLLSGYMKRVDTYINSHTYINTHANASAAITMDYHFGNDTHYGMTTKTAAEWLEVALQAVATPHPRSPGAKRLAGSGDALAGDSG